MSKKKTYFWILIAFGLLMLVGCLWLRKSKMSTAEGETQQRCFQKACFYLETAKTPEQRSQGLMFRKKLDKNYGMVFIFSDVGKHPFWMKNTMIPLDMIRLDAEYNIVDTKEVNPCTQDPCPVYTPVADARYVIELNQGIAKSLGMKPGNICIPK